MPSIPLFVSSKHDQAEVSNDGAEILLDFSPPLVLPRDATCSMELVEWAGVNSFHNVSEHLRNDTLVLKAKSAFSVTVASGHTDLVIANDGGVVPAHFTSLLLHIQPAGGSSNDTIAFLLPDQASASNSVITLGRILGEEL